MKKQTKQINTTTGNVFTSYQPAKKNTSGPTLVFVHGWGSDYRVWSEVVRASRSASLCVDLPGFGSSPVPPQPLSVDDYADVLVRVIDTAGLKNVILVGHSFGGQIATALAARQPQWLHGLVLVGSASLRDTVPSFMSQVGQKIGPVFRLPVIRNLRPVVYKIIGADMPPEDPVMRRTMRRILREDQRDKLSDIQAPTQVIWGSRDSSTPLAEGEEIARRIPKSVLTVLDGGHYIFIDQPTAFIDTLSSFLKRIS